MAVHYPDGTVHAAETLGEAERARLHAIPISNITPDGLVDYCTSLGKGLPARGVPSRVMAIVSFPFLAGVYDAV